MNLEIKKKKGARKVQQIVWISYDTFQWILKLCNEMDLAPNTVISALLDKMKEYSEKGEFQPLKVIEKEVVKGVYKCLFCNKVFTTMSNMVEHMVEHKGELKRLLESWG